MEALIAQYLLENRECRLSEIGLLKMKYKPAEWDVIQKLMYPPKQEIVFTEDGSVHDSGFSEFLASLKNIPIAEAEKQYYEFCKAAAEKIKEGRSLELPALGFLQKNVEGKIVFVAAEKPLLKPVSAERVIHKDKSHAMVVGDKKTTTSRMTEYLEERDDSRQRWWIAPVILAVIAIGGLIYHFSSHPFTQQGIANTNVFIPENPPLLH